MSYFDPDGNRITVTTWQRMFEDRSKRVVQQTTVHHKWWVSTVWLGLDHSTTGPPLIYETMIFEVVDNGNPRSEEYRRYPTRGAAKQGHARLVKHLREGKYIPFR